MKKKKSLLVVGFLALALLIAGCQKNDSQVTETKDPAPVETPVADNTEKKEGSEVENTDDYYPVTIENYNHAKEVVSQEYTEAPKKVLAVYQNSIETMLALGLEDHILAASGLDHAVKPEYEGAFEKLNYLDVFAPDKETVMMMEPDMILSWYSYFGEKNLGEIDYWNDKGIKTYISLNSGATSSRTLENEYIDILNLGKIFNVNDKAEAIVNEIKDEVKKVEDYTKSSSETPRVAILEKLGDKVNAYGASTLGGDMVKALGADLQFPDGQAVGDEDLVNVNPEIIFTVYMDRDDVDAKKDAEDVFLTNPALQNVDAIKNKRVIAIPLGEMYCSGIRTIDGLMTFAKGMYPDLYK